MHVLSFDKKVQVLSSLVEGNSIRATCRMTGVAKGTVTRLLESVGKACDEYQDVILRNLPCKTIQCDEIWSYCYAKGKNVPKQFKNTFGYGDVWTWVAIDADTKLVPSWSVGLRDIQHGYRFIKDLKSRLANRVQLSTDGHSTYLSAVEDNFGSEVDYAQIIKIYGQSQEDEKRYSPAECIRIEKRIIQGDPDITKISTSYIERQNLTMRMNMRSLYKAYECIFKKDRKP